MYKLLVFGLLAVVAIFAVHHFPVIGMCMATAMAYNGINSYESDISWQGDPYGWGDSPGMTATSPQGFTGAATDGGPIGGPAHADNRQAAATDSVLSGNPIQGMVIFLILVFVIMFTIHHFGKEDNDFTSIRASVYNAAIIGLAATATVPLYKALAGAAANANLPGGKQVYGYVKAA